MPGYWWDDDDWTYDWWADEDQFERCKSASRWDAPADSEKPVRMEYPVEHGASCPGHWRFLTPWQRDNMEANRTVQPLTGLAPGVYKWVRTLKVSDEYL